MSKARCVEKRFESEITNEKLENWKLRPDLDEKRYMKSNLSIRKLPSQTVGLTDRGCSLKQSIEMWKLGVNRISGIKIKIIIASNFFKLKLTEKILNDRTCRPVIKDDSRNSGSVGKGREGSP